MRKGTKRERDERGGEVGEERAYTFMVGLVHPPNAEKSEKDGSLSYHPSRIGIKKSV